MRGSVAFRPLFLSSSAWVMACRRAARRRVAPAARIVHHIEVGRPRRDCATPMRHFISMPRRCRAARLRCAAAAIAGCWPAASRCELGQLRRRHHALPGRGRAGQRRHQRAGRALVKPGMSRAQVRDVLGSPLLTDLFHADRWDYVFTIRRQGADAAAARAWSCSSKATSWRASKRRRPADRARVHRLDRHLQDRARRAGAGPDRRADQGAAGAARGRRRRELGAARRRRAATRRSNRAHDAAPRSAVAGAAASPSPAPRAAWAAC